jgi:hypothetical protein
VATEAEAHRILVMQNGKLKRKRRHGGGRRTNSGDERTKKDEQKQCGKTGESDEQELLTSCHVTHFVQGSLREKVEL